MHHNAVLSKLSLSSCLDDYNIMSFHTVSSWAMGHGFQIMPYGYIEIFMFRGHISTQIDRTAVSNELDFTMVT